MTTGTIKRPDTKGAADYFKAKSEYTTGPVEVSNLLKNDRGDIFIIDLRAEADYHKGHLSGAFNLPQGKWETGEGLSKDKTNILYCYSQNCHLAVKAGAFFASKGYPVIEMEGGFKAWKEAGLPAV